MRVDPWIVSKMFETKFVKKKLNRKRKNIKILLFEDQQ